MFNLHIFEYDPEKQEWISAPPDGHRGNTPPNDGLIKLPANENEATEKYRWPSKAIVVLNGQQLLPEQKDILKREFDSHELIHAPAAGWTKGAMKGVLKQFDARMVEGASIVFVTPVPVLLMWAAYNSSNTWGQVAVFHNDHREEAKLPSGKTYRTVARTGWELVTWEDIPD